MTEQVEGHHVQPLGGQGPRQRLLHPARHQLAVEQHDPVRAGAVLGVLEPVACPSRCRRRTARCARRPTWAKSSRCRRPALGRWGGETGRDRDLLRHGAARRGDDGGGRAVHALRRRGGHRLAVLRPAAARRRDDVHRRRRTPGARPAGRARPSTGHRVGRRGDAVALAAAGAAGHEAGRYPLLALPADADVADAGRTRVLAADDADLALAVGAVSAAFEGTDEVTRETGRRSGPA